MWIAPALLVAACSSTPGGGDIPLEDSGKTDLGTDPTDSGTNPTDTGTNPTDRGFPTKDTGSPTDDTGSPTDDTGSPTDDTGSPTDDTGSPTDDTGSPVGDTGSPTDDTGSPTTDGSVCAGGQTFCGTSCVDTNVDNTNCGTCGTSCPTGQSCQVGVCRASCAAGQTLCGTTCVTLDSDPANCGTCGTACPSGQMCSAGRCALTCASPRVVCTDSAGAMGCVDTLTDASNCGVCGSACTAGQSCVAGTCRLVCPSGQTACGGACVDTNTSNANCGGCGTACPTGQSCAVGMCRRDCAAGETRCGDACVNTQTSSANCGACGTACTSGRTCVAGACACPTGQTLCGTACLDLQTDVANCGSCANACPTGQVCTAGTCRTGATANDLPAGATVINMTSPAQTLTGTTVGATNQSGCGTAGDVYYRFTLTARELVYVDTFGTSYDTRLAFAPSTGTGFIADTCIDDVLDCTAERILQTRLARVLTPGTYYVVVGGFADITGPFTLHFQHLPVGNGPVVQITSFANGTQTFPGTTSGTGVITQTCRAAPAPENTYWFMTCPAFPATQIGAATCGAATWDTVVEQRSAARTANLCDDDSCGAQSTVTGTLSAGAGLHTIYVDGFSTTSSGAYTLSVSFANCPAGQNLCGSTCVNLQTSATNCGACGTVCTAPTGGSVACTAGACVRSCPAGQSNCSNVCRATATDVNNCGACGTVCAPQTGGTVACAASTCVRTCPTGQNNCSNTCRNFATDNNNCGACGVVCAAGNTCQASVCRPANNDRASATAVTLLAGETTVTGTTAGATFDGPAGCGDGVANVWYRVTLTGSEVLYADTAGTTAYDSRLYLVNSAGALVANTCSDDAGCTTGGFAFNNARFATLLPAGTYYIGVSGFNTGTVGAFTLHLQHLPRTIGSFFYDTAISGTSTATTTLVGTSAQSSTCGGTASGEDVRWFMTCGATTQFFSLCSSDGGTFSRRIGTTNYDPALYLRSGQSGAEVTCNDDGGTMGGTACAGTGTGADTSAYGSRLNNVTVPRGINAVFVDERVGGSGMTYRLAYTVR